MGGLEVSSTDRKSIGWEGWGFVYDNGGVPSLDYKLFKQQIEEGHTYYAISPSYRRSFAAFANATYSYKARYVLNGTIRYEGTNKLGMSRNSRWLPTWNVSGAWNAHEEGFFREKVDPKCFHTQQPVCHTHLQPTADHQASPTPHLFIHQEQHGVRRHPTKSLCLSFRHLETQS